MSEHMSCVAVAFKTTEHTPTYTRPCTYTVHPPIIATHTHPAHILHLCMYTYTDTCAHTAHDTHVHHPLPSLSHTQHTHPCRAHLSVCTDSCTHTPPETMDFSAVREHTWAGANPTTATLPPPCRPSCASARNSSVHLRGRSWDASPFLLPTRPSPRLLTGISQSRGNYLKTKSADHAVPAGCPQP